MAQRYRSLQNRSNFSSTVSDSLGLFDAKKFGHFLIPAIAFVVLVIGPLRRRPLLALLLCAAFAVTVAGVTSRVCHEAQVVDPFRAGA